MTLYAITANVHRTTADGYVSSLELPLFFLDSRVQGILSASGAASVARNLLQVTVDPDATITVSAEEASLPVEPAVCSQCSRRLIDASETFTAEATGDDDVWRETCDASEAFTAEHRLAR